MTDNAASVPATSGKPAAGGVKTFSCPSCGGTVSVRAVGISITATCQSCGSIIDINNEELRVISKAALKTVQTALPLGARGTLFDAEWEVIGYLLRSDETEQYKWREYLLFNPWQGFRYLVESDGHWNFVQMVRRNIDISRWHTISFDDESYRLYVKGQSKVLYVMGEFYWRVKVGETVDSADYVSPPYMLSVEKSDEDIIWSHAVYVERDEIAGAFGVHALPAAAGIAPDQPSPYSEKLRGIKLMCAVFMLALIVLQLAAVGASSGLTIYGKNALATPADKGTALISNLVTIPDKIGNIEITAWAPVDNNWVELDTSLVSNDTQESYDALMSIEYYHGHDSDGYWSEGSQTSRTVISSVSGGDYRLLVEPDAGAFASGNNGHGAFVTGQPVSFQVTIKRNVPDWSNFLTVFLLILAYPAILLMRGRQFEVKRWSAERLLTL